MIFIYRFYVLSNLGIYKNFKRVSQLNIYRKIQELLLSDVAIEPLVLVLPEKKVQFYTKSDNKDFHAKGSYRTTKGS